jgi:Ca2+-binding EF-hand superfamily protein
MTGVQWAGLAALAFAMPLLGPAQEPKATAGPMAPAVAEAQDLVFLSDKGPVLLRLRVTIDGKPAHALWRDYIRKWFNYLDRDGKGYLTREQVQFAPKGNVFNQQLRERGLYIPFPGSTVVPGELGKGPLVKKVTLDDLLAYYARTGAGPIHVKGLVNSGYAGRVSNSLFKHLDQNGDGKLTPDELGEASQLLPLLDTDDDETLSPEELLPDESGQSFQGMTPSGGGRLGTSFYMIAPGGSAADLPAFLLSYYGKNRKNQLGRAEIELGPGEFDRLDVNKDGVLDGKELARWHLRSPDLELIVRVGKTDEAELVVDTALPSGQPAPLTSKVARPTDGVVLLTLGDAQVGVQRGASGLARRRPDFNEILLEQFRIADAKRRGYIERTDLKNLNEDQLLRLLFALVDRDGDGRMTEAELRAWLELQAGAVSSYAVLGVLETGRDLFDVLDTNRDGRLGLRELRTAWQRLAPLDREGKGFVRQEDLPRQFRLVANRGGIDDRGLIPLYASRERAPSSRGPLWFRKMDRNGDGDVSLREFLGSRADFARIDADGDGLIDADEAARADEWFRQKLPGVR